MHEIKGSSFVLRPYQDDDAESVRDVLDDITVWGNLGHSMPHPYTIENARAWIAKSREAGENALSWSICIDGTSAGGVNFRPAPLWSPHTYELGYWLSERYRGRGIATEVVALLTKHAMDQLNAERMQAFVYSWNPASCRVLEKNGYTLEGRLRRAVFKDGRWGDALAYGRLRL